MAKTSRWDDDLGRLGLLDVHSPGRPVMLAAAMND
jgi:hypothetical protein